ncbi:UNVERIFIED_CONTAM: hypothetical protein RMT77_007895 [Armadillidium vulgare]
MSHMENRRTLTRRPSFVMVGKEEEEEMNCFSILRNMGIPILYIFAAATTLIGSIAMAIITNYWAQTKPPSCFLYNETPTMGDATEFYVFGTKLSCCYWVAYGGIAALVILCICGVLYVFHVKDDKQVTLLTYITLIAMCIATLLILAVSCTFAQGYRITCMNISQNSGNKKGLSCRQLLDYRTNSYNFPVKTSSMVAASMANLWIATGCYIVICVFHIALVIRRASAY